MSHPITPIASMMDALRLARFTLLSILMLTMSRDCLAQSPWEQFQAPGEGMPTAIGSDVPIEEQRELLQLKLQLAQQAAQIQQLQQSLGEQNEEPSKGQPLSPVPTLSPKQSQPGNPSCTPELVQQIPLVAEVPLTPGYATNTSQSQSLDYFVDYEQGFLIRPFDTDAHPFELRVNGWIQFRHHGFCRDVATWTDQSGVTLPVSNRNAFDIERGRLVFQGTAIAPQFSYFLQLDGDTDGGHGVDFFDYWWGWELSDGFQIQVGKRKVPASLQWLLSARRTRFVDRPLANDFFRPDRTVGVFGVGKLGQRGAYEIMIGNGYNSSNLPNSSTDDQLTFAFYNHFNLGESWQGQIVDFEQSLSARTHLGHYFVYSPQTTETLGTPLSESNYLRLSDGTRLNQTSALAPNVTVSEFDLFLYGIDLAWRYRGWSATSEVYLRWLENLKGDGPLPRNSLFQKGMYVEFGKFLIPSRFDVNFRYSVIDGEFGSRSEYATGCNWYPLAKPTVKLSFDVTQLNGSPLNNSSSDILAGDSGTLFRTQFQTEF